LESLFDRARPFAGARFGSDPMQHAFGESALIAFLTHGILPHARLKTIQFRSGKVEPENVIFLLSLHDHEIELGMNALSQGYQATSLWILDLLYRLLMDAVGPVEPCAMEGLVLIDEIDMHLHPQWQVNLIPTLKKLFPRMQFVVT